MPELSFSERVHIPLGERSYDILIGSGLLDQPAAYDAARAGTQALIVTNTTVAPLYAERLARALAPRQPLGVERADGGVGDDERRGTRARRLERRRVAQQAAADVDVVAALAQRDVNALGR